MSYELLGATDNAGVRRVSDGAFIPPDLRNKDWQDYLTWRDLLGDVNVPKYSGLPELDQVKQSAKADVDEAADAEIATQLAAFGGTWGLVGGGAALGFANAELLREAHEIEGVGSPAAADYPLLNALIGVLGASDLSNAGTLVRAEWDAVKSAVGSALAVQRGAHANIDAATTEAGVQAVLDSIDFPIRPAPATASTSTTITVVTSEGAVDHLVAPLPAEGFTETSGPGVGVSG